MASEIRKMDKDKDENENKFAPYVVIFVEDGEVKLVNSDVPVKVILVEYVDWAECDFSQVYEFGEPDDPDYAYINMLDAVVDINAVDAVWEMWEHGPNLDEEEEDKAVIATGKEG